MIHIRRLSTPIYLQGTKPAQWAQSLCRQRAHYYQLTSAYHRGGRAGSPPKRPRTSDTHYAHREVREALETMFGTKCAYCETEVRASHPQHIEHYRPQSIYPALAYRWENLLLSCYHCNVTYKSARFPITPAGNTPKENRRTPCVRDDTDDALLLNPCTDLPEQHLTFRDGRVVALTERGKWTQRICRLNRQDLVNDRRKFLYGIQIDIERFLIARLEGDSLLLKICAKRLYILSADTAEYAGMVRAELAQAGIDRHSLPALYSTS